MSSAGRLKDWGLALAGMCAIAIGGRQIPTPEPFSPSDESLPRLTLPVVLCFHIVDSPCTFSGLSLEKGLKEHFPVS